MTRPNYDNSNSSPRSLPRWLAPFAEQFELEGKTIVRFQDIQRARPELTPSVARRATTELVRRGWLRPLGFRGIYEFIPGAAAGRYPSADPWLPLRAWMTRGGEQIHVGGNSAAWLWGYLERSPTRHILVTSRRQVSNGLAEKYRIIRTTPAPASASLSGLPVPTPSELLVEVAQIAPRLPLDAAAEWLPRLVGDVSSEEIHLLLNERGPATIARAGFLAEISGADDLAEWIHSLSSVSGGPFYSGPRRKGAKFYSRWRLYDTGRVA